MTGAQAAQAKQRCGKGSSSPSLNLSEPGPTVLYCSLFCVSHADALTDASCLLQQKSVRCVALRCVAVGCPALHCALTRQPGWAPFRLHLDRNVDPNSSSAHRSQKSSLNTTAPFSRPRPKVAMSTHSIHRSCCQEAWKNKRIKIAEKCKRELQHLGFPRGPPPQY